MPKITSRELEAKRKEAKRIGSPIVLWDTELRGFGCRISPTGRVSWLVKKLLGKGGRGAQQIKYTLKLETNDPDNARAEALNAIVAIKGGASPIDQDRQERKAQQAVYTAGTVSEAIALYVKLSRTDGRYWNELEKTLNRELADFKDTSIAKLTKADIRPLIDAKQANFPGAARTLFAALRPFFDWCVDKELVAASPLANVSPPKPVEDRDRVLTKRELKGLWQSTEKMGHPWLPFYRLLLLTGQRREEVAGMAWQELDLDDATWTIPKERTKNNVAHIVHLSPQALAVLATLTPVDGCPFVFTTNGATSMSGFSKAKARLDGLMGIVTDPEADGYDEAKLWRVHDLRRTITSTLAELGVSTDVADRLLNHVSGSRSGVKGVYQRYEFLAERKKAIERWGYQIEQLINATTSDVYHASPNIA